MTGTSIFVKAHERHLAQPDWYFDTVESVKPTGVLLTKGFKDGSNKGSTFLFQHEKFLQKADKMPSFTINHNSIPVAN